MAKRKLQIPITRKMLPMLEPHRYKGIHGGRGGGKSWFLAELMIEMLVEKPNLRCICIREFQSSIRNSVKRLLEDKIEDLKVGDYFEVQQSIIKSKVGKGEIHFQGLQDHTADSIKSLEGFDIFWVEEAQSLKHRSLELLTPTARKEGAELWFSWNPYLPTDPIDKLLRGKILPDDAIVIEVNYPDNPWFPKSLRREMEFKKRTDIDAYSHIWMGGYVKNSEARVFKNWIIEEFTIPPDAMFDQGADWGFANDPTVLIRSYIIGRTLYICDEAYKIGCEINDTPKLFGQITDSEKWSIVADSARPETISYMLNHGYPKIYAAAKGRNSVMDGIEFLKSYDIIVHPKCVNTIDELISYSFKVDPMTGKVTNILQDKKNHVIDALRYGNEDRRRKDRSGPDNIIVLPNPTKNYWGKKSAQN